jgi:hypothetical protein
VVASATVIAVFADDTDATPEPEPPGKVDILTCFVLLLSCESEISIRSLALGVVFTGYVYIIAIYFCINCARLLIRNFFFDL